MLIFQLLKYVAGSMPDATSEPVLTALETAPEGEVQWALAGGLGPLLFRATRSAGDRLPPTLRTTLASADLTAQVRHDRKIDAARHAIDLCSALGTPVVVLKGISISTQYYPAGHLRPMSDIDLLIPAADAQAVEAAFLRRGYRQGPNRMGPDPHHGEPLFDPQRGVWIELHTALFPGHSPLRQGRVFSASGIAGQSVAATFEGRPVRRLSRELQLIYVASSWVRDVSTHGIHPGFILPVMDAVCLLTATGPPLDWERLFGLLDDPMAAASLLILLAYLSKHGVAPIPSSALARLAANQNIAGRLELAILAAMVHRYLIGGRPFRPFNSWHVWTNLIRPGSPAGKLLSLPWNILFAARYPERYNLAWQRARFARRLRCHPGREDRIRSET